MNIMNTYVVLSLEEWERMKAILSRRPDVIDELSEANIIIQKTTYELVNLVNSDGEVVATYPCKPTIEIG